MTKDIQQIKILLVDEHPENLQLLSDILCTQGYQVQKITSGQSAICEALNLTPDLILLDILIPEMSVYEVFQGLKANKITQNIPIIFLGNINQLPKSLNFLQLDADYITKPFHSEEVLVRVQNQLTIQKLQKQLKTALAQVEWLELKTGVKNS